VPDVPACAVPGAPGGSPNKIINQKGRRVERWSCFVGDNTNKGEDWKSGIVFDSITPTKAKRVEFIE
jgi:hypothetical protein